MGEIRVSVIIPVYNMEKYLNKCLDTVVNQTLKEIEIIIIDDGSTDASPDIIQEYAQHYRDKIICLRKENGGQGMARNIAVSMSKGEYIGFVDADDYIELDMYENLYTHAKANNLDYLECDYKFLREDDNGNEMELKQYGDIRYRSHKYELFIDPLVSPWNKIYKGDLLRNNQIIFPEGVIYEDTSFYVKAIPYINSFSFIDKVYVKHFLRSNSTMTGSRSIKTADIFEVIQDVIDFYKENDFWNLYKDELEYFSIKILLCSSIERISKISEKSLRKKFVNKTFEFINCNFPDYKNNKYIDNSIKGLYIKNSNRFICRVLVSLLCIKNRINRK